MKSNSCTAIRPVTGVQPRVRVRIQTHLPRKFKSPLTPDYCISHYDLVIRSTCKGGKTISKVKRQVNILKKGPKKFFLGKIFRKKAKMCGLTLTQRLIT